MKLPGPIHRRIRRVLKAQAGVTLAEVLTAMAVVGIALVGILPVIPVANTAVQTGRQSSIAALLAEQELERVKAMPYADLIQANFPAEGYGTIASYGAYRRTVAITNDPGGIINTRLVAVQVFFRPLTSLGGASGNESGVQVSGLVAQR
jgi:prepilin-type N-terminal cleavage/methylation domain-containing protein